MPSGGGTAPVSWTIGHGGSWVSAAVSPLSVRDQVRPSTSPGVIRSISTWPGGLAEALAQRRLVFGEVEDERVPQAEGRAQLGGQAGVERAARQADLDADEPAFPRGIEQPGHPEPADPEPVRDVDLGDALQVELPRHPRGQDNFGRSVCRQAGHGKASANALI